MTWACLSPISVRAQHRIEDSLQGSQNISVLHVTSTANKLCRCFERLGGLAESCLMCMKVHNVLHAAAQDVGHILLVLWPHNVQHVKLCKEDLPCEKFCIPCRQKCLA